MDSLKSLILLWDHLAEGLEIPSKDRSVFCKRALSEGITFLTKTLPSFGKAVDAYLINGETLDFSNVRFSINKGENIPCFLRRYVRTLVTPSSLESRVHAIRVIRQLTLLYYKLEVPYGQSQLQSHYRDFRSRDCVLVSSDVADDRKDLRNVLVNARKLMQRVLCNIDPFDIRPRHGSGAVAEKILNRDKWHVFNYIPRLDQYYPYPDHFYYDYCHFSEDRDKLDNAIEVSEPHSRLVAVPKDSRGPRLICCEPKELMYIQQGIMSKLYEALEGNYPTKGFINFTRQDVNQELARQASLTQELGTLDLSDASDRVSWSILKNLLPPRWKDALGVTRSRFVDFPDGTTYGPLRKFAPMGSACCFPIEALYFWCIIKGSIDTDVWVYGDDIVLARTAIPKAIELLESVGLVVNVEKSCYKTAFAESCGKEYYHGYDVGYVKARRLPSLRMSSRSDFITFAQLITERHGLKPGLKVLDFVDEFWKEPVPTTRMGPQPDVFYHPDAPVARNNLFFKKRWSRDLHFYEYKILTATSARIDKSRSDSKFHRCEMLRNELSGGHIQGVGCYDVPVVKTRWSYRQLG